MPDLTLGSPAPRLTVWLVDAAPFTASVSSESAFPAAPELVFGDGATWPGTLSGDSMTATWVRTAEEVGTLTDARPRRVTLRDPGTHHVYASGTVWTTHVVEDGTPSGVAPSGAIEVDTLDGSVHITYTTTGGGGGGSDVLTVVDGDPVELDEDLPVGHLLGFRVLSSTLIGGRTFAPGDYIVSRTTTGWDFRLLEPADALAPDPVPDVEVTATGPTWTDDEENGGGTWTTPTEEGITYSPASGTANPGEEVAVTATEQEGYDLVGTASWSHTFPAAPVPPDTTNPTGGTLTVSGTGDAPSTRTLTVTGATDPGSGGLHAQPYAFSTDGGTTWSTYQSSNVFTTGALSAGTYQPRVMVRDAAGNTATASAADFTVSAGASDTFTRADQALAGTTTETGGLTYVSPANSVQAGTEQLRVISNAAGRTTTATPGGAFALNPGTANHRIKVAYNLVAAGAGDRQVRVSVRMSHPTSITGLTVVHAWVKNDGTSGGEQVTMPSTFTPITQFNGTGHPLTGTIELEASGSTVTLTINGVQIGQAANTFTGTYVGAAAYGDLSVRLDDLVVTY